MSRSDSAGVQALTGPASGPIGAKIRRANIPRAARMLSEWQEVFGERLAVEVQLHHTGGCEAALAAALIEIAESSVPWVATNDPRYIGSVEPAGARHSDRAALRHYDR